MTNTKTRSAHTRRSEHKRILAAKGWSYRQAAAELGVHLTHFNRVLQGERISASLLKRIEELPEKGARK